MSFLNSNNQANLFIYIEFVLHKFKYVYLFLRFCVCMNVCVCIYVCVCVCACLHNFFCAYMCLAFVASILAAFLLFLFCLCLSKIVRVIHHYYLLQDS